jgi:hypothetical protein
VLRWCLTFVAVSLGVIALGYLAVWFANDFEDTGLDLQGHIAMVLGSILLSGLGVGLMALMFYSNASGRDDEVGRVHREDREQP